MLKVFFLAAFITAALFPTQQAMAAGNIDDYFDTTSSTGNFTATSQTMSISYTETQVSESQVVFTVNLHPITTENDDVPAADDTKPGELRNFTFDNGGNMNSSEPSGIIAEENDLGVWDSLYSDTLRSNSGMGIWIDYGPESTTTACLFTSATSNFYSDTCLVDSSPAPAVNYSPVSLLPYMLKNDGTGKMRMLSTDVTFNVQVNKLKPGTKYQARLRIEGEGVGAALVGSTPLIHFETKAEGTGLLNTTQIENESANSTSTIDPETGLPSCGVFGENSSILGCVAQIIYSIIFKPTSTLMVLAGEIMDWGIGFSIDSSSYPVSGHSFVTDGWRIMRDLANILFIFILVYVAISTIFGKDEKRLIAMVILVALIINFSLFVTKVIVDIGNITSRFFYNNIAITNSQAGNVEIFGTSGHKSISYGFAATFNPVKIFSSLSPQTSISTAGGITHTGLDNPNQYATFFSLFSIVGAIVNLVAAFVFFSLAWLFIARTAGIWLAMIFAPLAFLSLTLPSKWKSGISGTGQYTSFGPWFSNLTSLAFMPVIALLMIFLILTFLKAPGLLGALTSQTTTGQLMTVLIPLIVLTILLLKTKEVATKWSGEFGGAMSKVGSFVGGAAIGVATGGAALVGRRALGGLGARMAANENWKKTALGRKGLAIGKRMETATYDLKNTKASQFAMSQAGFNPNKFVNTTVKDGYKTQKDKQVKERKEYLDRMKLGEGSDEVTAHNEAKETHDKKKESYNDSFKKWKEIKDINEDIKKSGGTLTQDQIDEQAEANADMIKKKKEVATAAADSENAKKAVELGNAAIIGSIVKNTATDKERLDDSTRQANAEYANATNFFGKAAAKVKQAARYTDITGTQVKDIVTGSVSGRQASVQDFRKQYKKAYDAGNKPAKPTPGAPTPPPPAPPGYPYPKTAATNQAATGNQNAPANQQPNQAGNQAGNNTIPTPTYTQTNTNNAGNTGGNAGAATGTGSIVTPIIVGGGRQAPPLTPLQTLSGVDDYRKNQPKSQTGYPIRQNAAKPAPRPAPNPAASQTLAPTPKPAPKPAPGPNNNGFSSPTFS
ncbi:MAG: hypothetical protein KA028_02555 [Candidatus Pacebacteria bacterium]|nr:hypothetical protein [Candidatus Paceibacterota bacterium]